MNDAQMILCILWGMGLMFCVLHHPFLLWVSYQFGPSNAVMQNWSIILGIISIVVLFFHGLAALALLLTRLPY
jgi:hypothetical protein